MEEDDEEEFVGVSFRSDAGSSSAPPKREKSMLGIEVAVAVPDVAVADVEDAADDGIPVLSRDIFRAGI